MLVLFFVFLFLSVFLAVKNPSYFLVFYVLASSKFLGFIDVESLFIFGGVGLAGTSLNIVALISVLGSKNRHIVPKDYFWFIFIFMAFVVYGIAYPLFLSLENIGQAVIASKEFWSISILIYLVVYRDKVKTHVLLGSVKYIGLYLAFSYLVNSGVGWAAPYYLDDDRFKGFYPTYISMALFIYAAEWQSRKIGFIQFLQFAAVLLVGLVLSGHLALTISTCFTLALYYLLFSGNRVIVSKVLIKAFGFVGLLMLVLVSFSTVREAVFSQYELIVSGEDAALASRDIYNEFRWNAIQDRPLGGYGFIHKSAPITGEYLIIQDNRFSEGFGVIDSGYVDLLVRFGYVGSFLYLSLWMASLINTLKSYKRCDAYQLCMIFYVLQYFLVNVTWSVLTFSHGLIPAFIAIYLVLGSSKRQCD